MKPKITFILVFFILYHFNSLYSQTFHTIIIANTVDKDAGFRKTCDIDKENIKSQIQKITQILNFRANTKEFIETSFEKDSILSYINSLNCSQNDIVFFYFSGHGARHSNDTTLFPQLSIKGGENPNNYLPLIDVYKKLNDKKPQLLIVLADCCNDLSKAILSNTYSKDETIVSDGVNIDSVYYRLFKNLKGSIIVCSSNAGESSGSNGNNGGFFTSSLCSVLDESLLGKINPNWNNIFDESAKKTNNFALYSQNTKLINGQHPYYIIDVKENSVSPPLNPKVIPNTNIPAVNNYTDISRLNELIGTVSNGIEWDVKMRKIDAIINDLFLNRDVFIEVYGKDNTTIIHKEKVKDYLTRVVNSTIRVKLIEISSEKNMDGKITLLKLHEIFKAHK